MKAFRIDDNIVSFEVLIKVAQKPRFRDAKINRALDDEHATWKEPNEAFTLTDVFCMDFELILYGQKDSRAQ